MRRCSTAGRSTASRRRRNGWSGRGAIVDGPREHLGHADRGVIQVRKLWKQTIESCLRGEEPPNLIRDPAQNRLVHVDVIEKLVKAGEMTDHVPRVIYVEK